LWYASARYALPCSIRRCFCGSFSFFPRFFPADFAFFLSDVGSSVSARSVFPGFAELCLLDLFSIPFCLLVVQLRPFLFESQFLVGGPPFPLHPVSACWFTAGASTFFPPWRFFSFPLTSCCDVFPALLAQTCVIPALAPLWSSFPLWRALFSDLFLSLILRVFSRAAPLRIPPLVFTPPLP